MKTSRRGLFALFAGAAALPLAPKASARPCLTVNKLPGFQAARDAQNYWQAARTETVRLAPKAPFTAPGSTIRYVVGRGGISGGRA